MGTVGAPSLYDPSILPRIKELSKEGATLSEIAEYIGVSKSTVYHWKAQHREFRHSLKIGRKQADDRVVRSLYEKATGYQHEVEKATVLKDGQVVKYQQVEKFAPDTTAAIFWLKNRRPDEWRENNAQASQLQLTLSGPLAERLVGHLTQGMNQPQLIDCKVDDDVR